MNALNDIVEGKSLTYAAQEAEFADYAHLSWCFSSMFEYPISSF